MITDKLRDDEDAAASDWAAEERRFDRVRDADPSTHVPPDWALELSPSPHSLNSMNIDTKEYIAFMPFSPLL